MKFKDVAIGDIFYTKFFGPFFIVEVIKQERGYYKNKYVIRTPKGIDYAYANDDERVNWFKIKTSDYYAKVKSDKEQDTK